MTKELNTIIDYSHEHKVYFVYTVNPYGFLFSAASLQVAWDEIKRLCEVRGVVVGDCDYRTKGPDVFDDLETAHA